MLAAINILSESPDSDCSRFLG